MSNTSKIAILLNAIVWTIAICVGFCFPNLAQFALATIAVLGLWTIVLAIFLGDLR